MGGGGQHVQQGPLLGQHLHRCPARLTVAPGIDALAELIGGSGQLGEAGVVVAQVRRIGHQIPLGHLDRRLHPALGLGVIGNAGLDFAAVVAAELDHGGVAHGDAGHMLNGHRALIVGQQIRRRPAQPAKGGVDAGHQRAHGAIPRRDDHPKA